MLLRDVKIRQRKVASPDFALPDTPRRETQAPVCTNLAHGLHREKGAANVCRKGPKHSTKLWFGVETAEGCREITAPVSLPV